MRRIGIIAFVLAVLMLFVGCTGCKSGKIYRNAEVSAFSREGYLPYLNAVLQFTDGDVYRELIKTHDELISLTDKIGKELYYYYNEDYEDYKAEQEEFLAKYDEEYFKTYSLLIAQFISRETNYLYSLKNISIDENNKLSVVIKEKRDEDVMYGDYYIVTADILKADLGNVTEVSVTITES